MQSEYWEIESGAQRHAFVGRKDVYNNAYESDLYSENRFCCRLYIPESFGLSNSKTDSSLI